MKKKFNEYYQILLLLSWFFTIIEIALHMPIISFITPYKIFLAGLGLLIIFRLVNEKDFFTLFFKTIYNALKDYWYLVIPIISYIIFDLISFLWTNDISFAISKYVSILSMGALLLASIYYIASEDFKDENPMQKLLFTIGITALATTLYTLFYFLIHGMTYYSRRFSMIEDYNQFSSVILFGYFILLLFIDNQPMIEKNKNIAFFISSSSSLSAVYLSGSRRNYYLMLAILFLIIIPKLIFMIKNKVNFKRIGMYVFTIILSFLAVFVLNRIHYVSTSTNYVKLTENNEDIVQVIGASSVEEILTNREALSKRETIWSIAIESYKEMPLKGKIFGGGASYHAEIYDTEENKPIIEKMYWKSLPKNYMNPHNFILVDLLSGGLIKTILMFLVLIGAFIALIMLYKTNGFPAYYLFLLAIMILGNIMVSSKFGFINEKFLWTILTFIFGFSHSNKKTKTD